MRAEHRRSARSSDGGVRRRPSWPTGVLAIAMIAAAAALAFVAVRGPEPARSLPDRVRAVALTLRCPVCQNLSVADSPSGLAQQMRGAIARDLQSGRTPDQIRERFVASYGEWVLLAPPRRGLELAVWILPALLFLAGLVVAGRTARRWSADAGQRGADVDGGEPVLSAGDRTLLDRALASMPREDLG